MKLKRIVCVFSMILLIGCAPRIDLSPVPTRDFKAIATQVAANSTATATGLIVDYQAILDIIGASGVILPLVADTGTNSFGPTSTTVGAQSLDFTWREPPIAFDTPPSVVGDVPVVTFNGTDEEADSPNAAFWSRVSGALSIGMWVRPSAVPRQRLFSKDDQTDREWLFELDGGRVWLRLYDNNASAGGMKTFL